MAVFRVNGWGVVCELTHEEVVKLYAQIGKPDDIKAVAAQVVAGGGTLVLGGVPAAAALFRACLALEAEAIHQVDASGGNNGVYLTLPWIASAFAQCWLIVPTARPALPPPGVAGPNEDWIQEPYYGHRGTFFADVKGDRQADAIVVNNRGITVRRSAGGILRAFGSNEDWTEGPYYGDRGTFFADVTGDGRADAIVVNNRGVTVRRSDGSRFLGNEDWTNGPYYGDRGTFFADVTGDGRADAIVVNDEGVTVRRSGSARFLPNEDWIPGPYYGDRRTAFADVTGDGRADSIVVNDGGITVRRS
jgi:hypothetical protein